MASQQSQHAGHERTAVAARDGTRGRRARLRRASRRGRGHICKSSSLAYRTAAAAAPAAARFFVARAVTTSGKNNLVHVATMLVRGEAHHRHGRRMARRRKLVERIVDAGVQRLALTQHVCTRHHVRRRARRLRRRLAARRSREHGARLGRWRRGQRGRQRESRRRMRMLQNPRGDRCGRQWH